MVYTVPQKSNKNIFLARRILSNIFNYTIYKNALITITISNNFCSVIEFYLEPTKQN